MLATLLVVVACLFSLTHSAPDFDFEALRYRDLKAAKSHGDLMRRSNVIQTKKSVVLTYAEATTRTDDTVFASRVILGSDRDTLFLEEFDHLIDHVECSGSFMTIVFRDAAFFNTAKDTCSGLQNGLLISSHSSCSEAGAHSIFNVLSLTFDDDANRVLLAVEQTTWHHAFPFRKIEFGHTSDPHYLQQHDRLARRQADPTNADDVASAAESLIPTSTPDVESVNYDLATDQTNTVFSWPAGASYGPNIPVTVGCKKCTSKGQLVLTQGEIVLSDTSDVINQITDDDEPLDLFQSGFFELQLNGFESSILLSAVPSGNLKFTYNLFQVPVLGFRIPGVGAAGVLFQPQLVFDVGIKGGIEFTWGFNVSVPNNSTLRLDIGQFNNSRITGFDQTSIHALPFNANTSDIELTLQAGLRPYLPLGISLSDSLTLLGGPYLDLPHLSTTATQLATSNANENCETGKAAASKFQNAFKNLTHIMSEMDMGAGFEFVAKYSGFGKTFNYSMWSTTSQLPTACLVYGSKETGFVEAKTTSAASDSFKPRSCMMLVLYVLAAMFVVM